MYCALPGAPTVAPVGPEFPAVAEAVLLAFAGHIHVFEDAALEVGMVGVKPRVDDADYRALAGHAFLPESVEAEQVGGVRVHGPHRPARVDRRCAETVGKWK